MPGGYDLNAPPIHVAPDPAESPVSWLRRTAARYQISPRDVLREGGTVRLVVSTRAAITRITSPANNITTRLGLSDDERRTLRALTPLGTALRAYAALYQRTTPWEKATASRYCPACLAATDPRWAKDWTNPLLVVCPDHHLQLRQRCPACHAAPYASATWLTTPAPLWRCTARTTGAPTASGRHRRPWCEQDLRTALATPATPDRVRAQQLLLDFADHPDDTVEVAGITVTGRIAFDAMTELATRPSGTGDARHLDPDRLLRDTAEALADTLDVLDQPTPQAAADRLQYFLHPTSPHAPVTLATALAPPPKNPLLGALQLDRHRHAMTAASQLAFRTAAAHAQYPLPDGHAPSTRRALRLPEHRPDRPVPTPARLPQTLWPGALPGLGEDPLDRAQAALLLAQMGSARTRAFLLVELGLPRTLQPTIIARTKNRRADGTWPQLLAHLERLLERLRARPPKIDYRNRRLLADDLDLLDRALQHTLDNALDHAPDHGTTTAGHGPTPLDLRRRFWELFTGGDALFAPDPLTVTTEDHPDWANHRHHIDSRHHGHFQDAFHVLDRSSPIRLGAPLAWRPP